MSDLKSKTERFALTLSKRKDYKLNEFFIELMDAFYKKIKELSPDTNLILKTEVLESENRKLKQVLGLFTDFDYCELTNEEYDFLDTMRMRGLPSTLRKPDFYSDAVLREDLSDYRDIITINEDAKFSLNREDLANQVEQVLIGYQQKLSQEIKRDNG